MYELGLSLINSFYLLSTTTDCTNLSLLLYTGGKSLRAVVEMTVEREKQVHWERKLDGGVGG